MKECDKKDNKFRVTSTRCFSEEMMTLHGSLSLLDKVPAKEKTLQMMFDYFLKGSELYGTFSEKLFLIFKDSPPEKLMFSISCDDKDTNKVAGFFIWQELSGDIKLVCKIVEGSPMPEDDPAVNTALVTEGTIRLTLSSMIMHEPRGIIMWQYLLKMLMESQSLLFLTDDKKKIRSHLFLVKSSAGASFVWKADVKHT